MASKHRKWSQRTKKIATIGVTTATATALTVGMVPASKTEAAVNLRDVALSAAVDYTQLISDSSSSLNNILFTAGNLGGTAAGLWNPLATAIPGGLLPTFTAGTDQDDLTSIQGLIDALGEVATPVPDLSLVPGLSTGATTAITLGLLPALAPAVVVLVPITAVTLLQLGAVDFALGALDVLNVDNIPSLGELTGLTVTQTTFNSTYNWPLLGLGPLLGLNGSTTVGNTFAQLPSLTGSALISELQDGLEYPPILGPAVDAILGLLGGINTPSVTAWVPSGSGTYGLPLGGSVGWLGTMPTVAIGPIPALSETETVVAIPILAGGAVLPLNLASVGTATTPGLVFPTATGFSTLAGTTFQTFSVPGLGLGWTSLNALSATYVGTNGTNYNSGTTIGALTTPFGTLPLVYSLGSFNAGTTGFGFTGPSLFTVGLFPSFQVGTAPTQQSPDGIAPADVLNLGLAVPTQLTDLSTILGLPNVGGAVSSVLTPVFNAVVAPIGSQITNALNDSFGPIANGLASGTEQVTGFIAEVTGSLPASTTSSLATSFTDESSEVVQEEDGTGLTGGAGLSNFLAEEAKPTTENSIKKIRDAADDARDRVESTVNKANERTSAAAEKARERAATALKNAHARVNGIAENGRKQVESAVSGVQKQVNDSVRKVRDAADGQRQGAEDKKESAPN